MATVVERAGGGSGGSGRLFYSPLKLQKKKRKKRKKVDLRTTRYIVGVSRVYFYLEVDLSW